MMKQRGRPKGRSRDKRSFGPLGDLIRAQRLAKGLGLSDVAKACSCSVQFVSNIEHGRAPLPWDKIPAIAQVLRLNEDELQAANLSVRSDFRTFVATGRGRARVATPAVIAAAAKDAQLQGLIQRYQSATPESRKRFLRAAADMLAH